MQEFEPLKGDLFDETYVVSIAQLCEVCDVQRDTIIAMVEEGLIEPHEGQEPSSWRFQSSALRRAQITLRLTRDLDVNLPGAAIALELMEQVAMLERRVKVLEAHLSEPT